MATHKKGTTRSVKKHQDGAPETETALKRRRHVSDDADWSKRVKTTRFTNQAPAGRLHVLVMGSGESGELGLGAAEVNGRSPESAEVPRRNHLVDPGTVGVVQVAVGGMHCAALTHDGQVLTWGVNDSKALGRDTAWKVPDDLPDDMTDLNPLESTPAAVPGLGDVGSAIVQVAACDNATFVLTASGEGNDGAYGFSKEKAQSRTKGSRQNLYQTTPTRIAPLKGIQELAAGVDHVLALTHAGNVYAWGSGHQSELGRRLLPRHELEALVPRPVALPKNKVTKIFAGFNHSFAIDTQGLVWTWGLNNFGQTGQPASEETLHVGTPAVVDGLRKYRIAHMAGGFHHSLACTEDGEVLAWGRCDDNQLGLDMSSVDKENVLCDSRGRPRILLVPAKVPDIKAHFVAAGIDNSFAIDKGGGVLSWGFSDNFRTGLQTEDSVSKPTLLRSKAMAGMSITFVGCGGQFSVVAGHPASDGGSA